MTPAQQHPCADAFASRLRDGLARNAALKNFLPVGQITGICSTSQEFRARAGKLVAGFLEPRLRRCESKAKKGSDRRRSIWKKFDTSGKSPAYLHHRKKFRARAEKLAAGFFNRAGLFAIARAKRRSNPIVAERFEKIDTSGKSPAYLDHRKNFGARAEKLAAGFFNRAGLFAIAKARRRSNPIVAERFGKKLTRRANHRHILIIKEIWSPRRKWPRVFSIERRLWSLRRARRRSDRSSRPPNDL